MSGQLHSSLPPSNSRSQSQSPPLSPSPSATSSLQSIPSSSFHSSLSSSSIASSSFSSSHSPSTSTSTSSSSPNLTPTKSKKIETRHPHARTEQRLTHPVPIEFTGQILISCVGLPARGKTHVSHSLERYLKWLGVKTAVFSLGDYRRATLGSATSLPSDYFAVGLRSPETEALRIKVQNGIEGMIEKYFKEGGGQVAIYDANNGTRAARSEIRAKFEPMGVHVFFIENMCDRDDIIESNIRSVKISSPDYKGWDQDQAVADYWRRIRQHEKTYEPIEQPSFPYVKVVNVGETVIVNNIQGYLQSRIVFFLMNIHNARRTVWFARSGQSKIEHSYKADSDLSPLGWDYAEHLKDFVIRKRKEVVDERKRIGDATEEKKLNIWVSSRRRCISTAQPFQALGFRVQERAQMSEINPGVIDGMTIEEIKEAYPQEYERSRREPYSHRYPRAESYHDLSVRLEPIIFELERDRSDLLIIAHASVLRCLFAYLKGLAPQDIPAVNIARGDLVEVTPGAYAVTTKIHKFWRPPKGVEDADHAHGDAFQFQGPPKPPSQPHVEGSVFAPDGSEGSYENNEEVSESFMDSIAPEAKSTREEVAEKKIGGNDLTFAARDGEPEVGKSQ